MRYLKDINELDNNFGKNSKVSKNGQLMSVYHGTNSRFDKFDASYMGKTDEGFYGRGFYFTVDKEYASEYGPIVIEAHLDVKNPFYLRTWSTLGSYEEINLRDDLSKLNGVPSYFKPNREIPKGFDLLVRDTNHGGDDVTEIVVAPKKELWGTDDEVYGPSIYLRKEDAAKKEMLDGYKELAVVQFNDMRADVEFDGGLANWVLQKLDRWNFHELLQKNGHDGIFVVGKNGDKTPIDEVSEIVVWDPSQIKIIK